ncbi:HesA/MoeB/ThiF family protein [Brytella acorum]|uniref:Molybdopterin-synthase adenylyltransferase n=1 Tax=Brytella acorum TaxID=2959299 RepID=A0AA35VD94_9PROT|nr:molybdopterin-synthase adenylyltransferase MoeB [Brytella acorum]MDF3625153.1 molybdopterin-synthase adenylyltransferase MoeB [Brytella acorum]CAI9122053.1 molybdopterin-synthase adenylyltransferase MoeB [Brytella acorum]
MNDPAAPDLDFSPDELRRYSRHILLPQVGAIGQARLRKARVLLIGAGGLGSPVALYLAAAGVGTIGLVDADHVDLTNLQRQIVFDGSMIGTSKVEAAHRRLTALNEETTVIGHDVHVDSVTADALIAGYDLVFDGSDNFPTRQTVSDACVRAGKTLVSGAVSQFQGQLSTFRPQFGGPCYRCLYPDMTQADALTCGQAGILGSVTGVIGTLAATEILKEITGVGRSLQGRVLLWDALEGSFRYLSLERDPHCPGCGETRPEQHTS